MLRYVVKVRYTSPDGSFIGSECFVLDGENKLKEKLQEISPITYAGYTVDVDANSINK